MKILLIIATILGVGLQAQATMEILSINGASNYDVNDYGNVSAIYGGIAGEPCGVSDTSTCNSCTLPNFACNQTRIHADLKLRIVFKVLSDISGVISVGTEDDGQFTTQTTGSGTTSGTLNRGDVGVVEIKWGNICADASSTTNYNCDIDGGDVNLIIGLAPTSTTEPVAANRISIPTKVVVPNSDATSRDGYDQVQCNDIAPSTGICSMTVYPGDRKAFVRDLLETNATSWPQSNGVAINYLRVFYSSVDFASANYDSQSYTDFSIDNDGVPTSDVITNLENDVTYFFRPAIVDAAGNVAFLASQSAIESGAHEAGAGCAPAYDDATCDLIATPSSVDKALALLGL